jgi:hypothetical protein
MLELVIGAVLTSLLSVLIAAAVKKSNAKRVLEEFKERGERRMRISPWSVRRAKDGSVEVPGYGLLGAEWTEVIAARRGRRGWVAIFIDPTTSEDAYWVPIGTFPL